MRILAELATIFIAANAAGALVVKFWIKPRRLTHREYQEQLRKENEELDLERKRLGL